MSPLRRAAASIKESFAAGGRAVTGEAAPETNVAGADATAASSAGDPPAWAKRMKRSQAASHGVQSAAHAVRSGDAHGGGASIDLSQGE